MLSWRKTCQVIAPVVPSGLNQRQHYKCAVGLTCNLSSLDGRGCVPSSVSLSFQKGDLKFIDILKQMSLNDYTLRRPSFA